MITKHKPSRFKVKVFMYQCWFYCCFHLYWYWCHYTIWKWSEFPISHEYCASFDIFAAV